MKKKKNFVICVFAYIQNEILQGAVSTPPPSQQAKLLIWFNPNRNPVFHYFLLKVSPPTVYRPHSVQHQATTRWCPPQAAASAAGRMTANMEAGVT